MRTRDEGNDHLEVANLNYSTKALMRVVNFNQSHLILSGICNSKMKKYITRLAIK